MFLRIGWTLLGLTIVYVWTVQAYDYVKGPTLVDEVAPCPGLYCGRTRLNETHNSACGQCPRGWKVSNNTHSVCQECLEHPPLYDWFFLAFHFLLVLSLHWYFIDASAKRIKFTKEVILLHICALIEVVLSGVLTVLINAPTGRLELHSCRVTRLSDWYSFFHNPNPNYEETLHCTQEVVFPLYSLVFVFYVLCGLTMLVIRPGLASRIYPRRGQAAVYDALYFLPILALIHGLGSGLVYTAYPYIVLTLSLVSCASHFAFKLDQSMRSLLKGCFTDQRNFIILIGHWALHAFGILAITQLTHLEFHLSLLSLIPLPALFYVITARFTDPVNFKSDFPSSMTH